METCRTCARCDFEDENKWFDLFHTTRCTHEIEEMRVEFNNWQLQITQNDGLPQKICSDCFSKFCNVFTFRLQCQQAQVRLKNIFDKIETQSIDADRFDDELEEISEQLLRIVKESTLQITKSTDKEENCHIKDFSAAAITADNISTTNATPPSAAAIVMLEMLDQSNSNNNNTTKTVDVTANASNSNGKWKKNTREMTKISVYPIEVSNKTIVDTDLVTTIKTNKNTLNIGALTGNKSYTACVGIECQSEREIHMAKVKALTVTKLMVDKNAKDELRVETETGKEKEKAAGIKVDAVEERREEDMHEQMDLHVDDIIEEDFEDEDVTIITTNELLNHHTALSECIVTELNGSLTQPEGYASESVPFVEDIEDDENDDYDEDDGVLEAFEPITLPTNTYNTNNNIISSTQYSPQTSTINYNSLSLCQSQEVNIVFECKYCHKTKDMPSTHFETQRDLLKHITNSHDSEYPFTCPQHDCKEGFRDAASRTVHMKSEHVAKHYECDVCGKKYADRFNLRHHHEKFHNDMDFGCETCGKRFYSRKSLNYHMKWHNPDFLLKCSQCDRLFINQRHLKCHEETHNGVRNSECCAFCGKIFASYLEKRIHMLENHLENLTTIERTECMLCREHYENEHELSDHIRSKHVERPKSSILMIANNKRVVRSKRQKNYSGIFQCEICSQRFNMKSALERHAAVHSSIGRPHKCPVETCAKRFKRAQDMNWHMKTHSNEKSNVCDICGKGFALKYVLNQHKRSHEVLEKNFKCLICGRAYLFEKSLRVHERVHTGDTYYRCDLCGENFVTHMKFKTHMMKSHDPNTTNLDDYNFDGMDDQLHEP